MGRPKIKDKSNNLSQPPSIFGDWHAYAYMQHTPPSVSQFRVVLGVGQAHAGFFWNRTKGPGMLPRDAQASLLATPAAALRAGGLGAPRPEPHSGFKAEPRKLSDF